MATYTTVVAGTVITATWGNNVRDGMITTHATAAARTSAISSPAAGTLTWRSDLVGYEGYDGTAYAQLPLQVIKRKTSDEPVNNSTTLQNDDNLAWAVSANGVYLLDMQIVYNSGTSADFKFGWTVPASCTMALSVHAYNVSTTLASTGGYTQASTVSIGGTATDALLLIRGVVTVSSTAGTVQWQWAQDAAVVANTIVRAGSYGVLSRIA